MNIDKREKVIFIDVILVIDHKCIHLKKNEIALVTGGYWKYMDIGVIH